VASRKPTKTAAKARTRAAPSAPVRAKREVSSRGKLAARASNVTIQRTKPRAAVAPAARRGVVNAAEARAVFEALRAHHADAHCELVHASPFQLVVATVLSAQSTDVMVNQVTPELFRRWPTALALAHAEASDVERVIGRLGFFRQKTKAIVGLSQRLVTGHGGEVPRTLDELVKLPGVGRKTANVVLGVAFGTPEGVAVDTHVQRLTQRLGWTRHDAPEEIEQDLMKLFPRADWDAITHVLIFHGRRVCTARSPACAACPVANRCPSAFRAESVGRKPARLRSP
jgi:endonuclease III